MGLDLKKAFPNRPRLKNFDYKGTYAYFITIRSKERSARFKNAEIVDHLIHILNNIAERERFRVLAYCFMPDHFHLLASGEDAKSDLNKKAVTGSRGIMAKIYGILVITTIS